MIAKWSAVLPKDQTSEVSPVAVLVEPEYVSITLKQQSDQCYRVDVWCELNGKTKTAELTVGIPIVVRADVIKIAMYGEEEHLEATATGVWEPLDSSDDRVSQVVA